MVAAGALFKKTSNFISSKAEPSISDPRNAGQACPGGSGFSKQNKFTIKLLTSTKT
jgi:hypothetical protein